MDRDRGWLWVLMVGTGVIALSLVSAFQAMRDPVPTLNEGERRTLYQSNLRNFAESCEGRAGLDGNAGLRDFCRTQARLLQLLSECSADCQARTTSFTRSEPSK